MKSTFTMDQAMAEASRCLLCHEPPCSTDCPAGTDPGKFIRQMRLRNLKGAVATVRRNNPLAGACGVLCPTARLCQKGCSASGIDRPIDIGALQRFLVEYGWSIGFEPFEAPTSNGIRVAVVGAGPSGLACAADLAHAGFEVTVIEALDHAGGIPGHALPDHRLPRTFVDREIGDIAALGVALEYGRAIETREQLEGLFAEDYQAVYLATGAWTPASLSVDGGEADGVWDAMTFLRRAKGDRDAMTEAIAGKRVAVIGGGDTAMDVAVSATVCDAADVYVIYRRSYLQMPGEPDEKLDALAAGVHFVVLSQPQEYTTDGAGKVNGVRIRSTRLGDPDESGRRSPIPIEGVEHTLPVDVVVEAIGLGASPQVRQLELVRFDGASRILVESDTGQTSAANVFAGGDAVRGPDLVVRAVADGRRAAAAITEALVEEVTL
jgi:glutamate synthase (NADPH) small chain